MKIKWIENYKKPCGEIKTPTKNAEVRIIIDGDVPNLMEYSLEPIDDGYIWATREREGSFSMFEQAQYWFYGYRTTEDMIRKKYNLNYRYFEII